MGIIIYKVTFLEKILKWSIKAEFSILLFTTGLYNQAYWLQLIVIIEKFLKKPRFFLRRRGSYHLLFCIIHFFEFLYIHSYAKE